MCRVVLLVGVGLVAQGPAAWSDGLTVTPESATIGAFGLEVAVGGDCVLVNELVLSSPAEPTEGDFEACLRITADHLEVTGAGATFRAGQEIRLGDGFSVAEGAQFVAEISPLLAPEFSSVQDDSPIAETVYNSTFYLSLDDLELGAADFIEHFTAYSLAGESQFVLTVRQNPEGEDALHLAAREDGGGLVEMTAGQELPLAAGWNKIDIEWLAGDGTGLFRVAINDGPFSGITGLTNGAALIESVRWGAIAGSLAATTGTMQLDGFNSWR